MTLEERDSALRGMRESSRRVFDLLAGAVGMTDQQIRAAVGRNGSISDRLEPLLVAGLVRPASKAGKQTVYAVTPVADIEAAASAWNVRRKKKKRRGERTLLSDLRKMVPGGASAAFYREMKWLSEAGSHLRANEVQMFWESAPFFEIELLAPLVREMIEQGEAWEEAYKLRDAEETRRRRETKLRETTGRQPEEAALFKEKADELAKRAL